MRKIRPRRFFHKTPYRKSNSFRGLKAAVADDYEWIDIDVRGTRNRVGIACHWPRPGVHDKMRAKGIKRRAKVEKLPWRKVRKLRSPDGYRIQTLHAMIRRAGKLGINLELEAKDSPVCRDVEFWKRIHAHCERYGVHAQVKSFHKRNLKAASKAGFTTIYMARGRRIARHWDKFIDLVRGRWRR